MTDGTTADKDADIFAGLAPPSPDELAQWAEVTLRAQTMIAEHMTRRMASAFDPAAWSAAWQGGAAGETPMAAAFARYGEMLTQGSAAMWTAMASANPFAAMSGQPGTASGAPNDRRFNAPEWSEHPVFALIRNSYGALTDQLLNATQAMEGLPPELRAKAEFAARALADAMAPTNIALTNPDVIRRAVETKGESLLKGLRHMLRDMERGQLSHVDTEAFEVGRNIATTPGKVIHETPLYQLIHYTPTTPKVAAVPLLIFPPWINRFYILDLNPAKSFVGWALDQGLSVFMVSWKSADASLADVLWDDYIAAQIDAIDTVHDTLNVADVHTIGYCVAGTTLAATLATLAARGEAGKVRSVTFFTAQVDFELAGDLKLFVDDAQLALLEQLSAPGYLDGRYMAATFNLLRGRDLIWNYVVNNYLLGNDYPPFDLLYWNGDTTNLPAKWHRQYLTELYRDNRLVVPGSLSAGGTPIDLTRIETPAYIQAGREDHIAPAASVWRLMHHLRGPRTFLLAGSGHIAGVVNPPAAGKYQYWTNYADCASLDDFVAGASETKGSWWPHWRAWLTDLDGGEVAAKGARIPGQGKRKAIEDAPGRYVKTK